MRRRSGGTEGGKEREEREPPKKKRGSSSPRRGDCHVGTQRSVRPRPPSETRPEDRSSRAIASSYPSERNRNETFLPPRRIKRRVFRVCARISEDLHQSSRESRLICKCWESPLNDSVHSFRLDYFQGDAIAGCRCFFFRRDSRNILFGRYSRSF